MSEFPNRATLEAAIVRVAFYYCQLNELHDIASENSHDLKTLENSQRARDHLYGELSRLTQLLSATPPDAPRSMPSTIRSDVADT